MMLSICTSFFSLVMRLFFFFCMRPLSGLRGKKVKLLYILILLHSDFCICTGGSLMFVPWAGLEPDGASLEVLAASSHVDSSLQGHEGIYLSNDSQSFPVTVPVPLSKGNSLHLERLFRLRNCSQDPETGSRGPRSCDGNEGAIGTLFPWQQS